MAAVGFHSGGGVIRTLQLTLTASVAFLGVGDIAKSAEWMPVESETPLKQVGSNSTSVRWSPVEAAPVEPEEVIWTPVEPSIASDMEEKIEKEAPIEDPANAAVAIRPPHMPSGTTFANDKAIWRDETRHPQISGTVPVGFGQGR